VGHDAFRVEQVGLQNSVLATSIKVYNPNAYPLQLKSASVDIFINDNFLGHSSLDSLITLPGRDTTAIPIRLTASAKDLLSNSVRVFLNPDVKLRLKGNARAGRSGFFVNVPIEYEGMQRIEF
jgi:LEA14-like dessication related protein